MQDSAKLEVLHDGFGGKATSVILHLEGLKICLDMGLNTFFKIPRVELSLPERIDLAIITHGHLGHGGGIVALPEELLSSFKFWAARPTFQILNTQIAVRREHLGNYGNRVNLHEHQFCEVNYFHKVSPISSIPDLSLTFLPGGHMCGASVPVIQWKKESIAYLSDWTSHSYGGNPGLDTSLLSDCSLVIAQLSDYQQDSSCLARDDLESILTESKYRNVLLACQPLGALQDFLIKTILSPLLLQDWEIYLDEFSFMVTQASCPACLQDGILDNIKVWNKQDRPLFNSGSRNGKNRLLLCGTASLWPFTPSYFIAQELLPRDDAAVILTEDLHGESPGSKLKELACQWGNMQVKEEVLGLFNIKSLNASLEKISTPRKHDNSYIISELVKKIDPGNIIIFGGETGAQSHTGSIEDAYS